MTATLTALSKEVANRLTTTFNGQFTCIHNSNVNYPLSEMSALHVDCWPQGLRRERRNAAARDRTSTIAIAIQQRAATQERVDFLTDLAELVLDSFITSERWGNGQLLVDDAGFSGADVFDKLARYDDNVFQTILIVNFKKFA